MHRLIIIPMILLALAVTLSCGNKNTAEDSLKSSDKKGQGRIDRSVPPTPVEQVNSDGMIVTHAISLYSTPKYPADFKYFDYVNPQAPKGGQVVQGAIGTFDNFNRYAKRGLSAPNAASLYDSLLVASKDEIEVYYGLIASSMEYPPTYEWIIFNINPDARFQDGKPITAEDIKFSFNKFFDEGVPQFREFYGAYVDSLEVLNALQIRFNLKEGNKQILVNLGSLVILPSQFWKDRNLGEPITEVPLGSSDYTIEDYSMGQYVRYKRIPNYWAENLPSKKGSGNFETIQFDMYRDDTVMLEALKAGDIDFRQESAAKQWQTGYTGSNFDSGFIIKEEIPHQIQPNYQAFVFNTSRPFFADANVREAISYMFDFEWTNKNLFYSQYTRLRSFFQNTPFEALGLPSEDELVILEPYRNQLPDRVFTEEFQPPVTDGSGRIRSQITTAKNLLNKAGWEIRDQKMVNRETGEQLKFEILLYSPLWERITIPLKENLSKIGVDMSIRIVDTTQYINRMRSGDYDMITGTYENTFFPTVNISFYWESQYIDRSYNTARVQDEVIDYFVNGIVESQGDNEKLLTWSRAFDRVLTWRFYTIPQWYNSSFRVAYWNKFSRPEIAPKYALGFNTWWYDIQKAQQISKQRKN